MDFEESRVQRRMSLVHSGEPCAKEGASDWRIEESRVQQRRYKIVALKEESFTEEQWPSTEEKKKEKKRRKRNLKKNLTKKK